LKNNNKETPEERENRLKIRREKDALRRQRLKVNNTETLEERENRLRKQRQYKGERRRKLAIGNNNEDDGNNLFKKSKRIELGIDSNLRNNNDDDIVEIEIIEETIFDDYTTVDNDKNAIINQFICDSEWAGAIYQNNIKGLICQRVHQKSNLKKSKMIVFIGL